MVMGWWRSDTPLTLTKHLPKDFGYKRSDKLNSQDEQFDSKQKTWQMEMVAVKPNHQKNVGNFTLLQTADKLQLFRFSLFSFQLWHCLQTCYV